MKLIIQLPFTLNHKNDEVNGVRRIWNVAIYARVSTDKKEQQESIPNQVQSLKKWLIEKSKNDSDAVYNLVEVYEDAGFSGSNFERDSFLKMKGDIEQGKVNMVLTRDLSRFARNYITAGYYLEDYFKANGIRFISVLDNVDTLEEVNDIVPFKNILNEMYIKDCSRRTKDGLKQRMIRGSSIASKPPYGYKFVDEYEGNMKTIKLVAANDETTEVVREIYNLYLQGWGFGRISTYLNEKGIAPPSARVKNFAKSQFGIWTNNTIRSILTNPKYGGIMVQRRSKKISYKLKKVIPTSEDEWIYGGEFTGIIDKQTFDDVQNLIKKRAKSYRYKGEAIHPFSTVMVCGECGGSMSYRVKYKGYKCTNSQMGGGRCTAHSVKEDNLKRAIISELKGFVQKYFNKQNIYEYAKGVAARQGNYDDEIDKLEREIKKYDAQFERVYMDKLSGIISQRNFETIIKTIQNKQEVLVRRKEELAELKKQNYNIEDTYKKYKDSIDRIINYQEFDRITVENLIEKIVVSEDKETNHKDVDIHYKFQF